MQTQDTTEPNSIDAKAIQDAVADWPHSYAQEAVLAVLRGLESCPAYRITFAPLRAGLLQALADQAAAFDERNR